MNKAEIADFTCKKLGVSDTATLTLASDFAKRRWQMIWNSALWRQSRHLATVTTVPGEAVVVLPAEFDLVTAVRFGESSVLLGTDELSALATNPVSFGGSGPVVAFAPMGKDAAGNCRIRLLSPPTAATPLLVVGKRKCVDLNLGVDSPSIAGADECLCAFVLYDLSQWMRQYTAAEIYKQEANALLEQMRQIENGQTTEIKRLIPFAQQQEVEF